MQMKNLISRILITASFAAALFSGVSCESENALAVIAQEDEISKYIESKFPDAEIHRNEGSNRIVLVPGSATDTVAPGDSVSLMVEGYIFKNSPSTQFMTDSTTLHIAGNDVLDGLGNGLVGAGLGEESYIIFSAKYGYYKASTGLVPPMSALMFHTLVTAIKKK